MARLLANEKLHEELRRLCPAILALYKKTTDQYPLSKVDNLSARNCTSDVIGIELI